MRPEFQNCSECSDVCMRLLHRSAFSPPSKKSCMKPCTMHSLLCGARPNYKCRHNSSRNSSPMHHVCQALDRRFTPPTYSVALSTSYAYFTITKPSLAIKDVEMLDLENFSHAAVVNHIMKTQLAISVTRIHCSGNPPYHISVLASNFVK